VINFQITISNFQINLKFQNSNANLKLLETENWNLFGKPVLNLIQDCILEIGACLF